MAEELKDMEEYIAQKKSQHGNKSERKRLDKFRRGAFKEKVENARIQREQAVEWKALAAKEIKETQEFIDGYGLEEYFLTNALVAFNMSRVVETSFNTLNLSSHLLKKLAVTERTDDFPS
ncbi:hypothetical protein BT63DRAFT_453484 [Microthyrium microscopicum]|uniref:Uncharacterized protein n=1 Tax=Microthyrium microscopicum TaxID=703497 RepID=A0A6A6UHR6_9PEZI|nr:hypothetical protein BT63DRAFT_453484 [Microthyrium microscopicum]